MKASKMTGEMLAQNIEATIPFLMKEARHLTDADECLREAAARLRKMDALRRRLKVAEDALGKIVKLVFLDCEVAMVANNALSAIREQKGETNGK